MQLIIDADPIVYRAGFSAEDIQYIAVAEDERGTYQATFTSGDGKTAHKRMQEWVVDNGLVLLEAQKVVTPGPVEHALAAVKTTLAGITAAVDKQVGSHGTTILLSGPGNYREKLATLKPYKGNRDADHKPFHYQAIRDYLTGHWGSRVVHGREADDEASILARERESVVATVDKDLDQIPGMHYDYQKHVLYSVDEDEAYRFFWTQVLSGDATDNIGGACGIGPGKATLLIKKWEAEEDDRDIWKNVVDVYAKQGCKAGCYYANTELSAHAVALENARLVYLQQKAGELWTPPGRPHERLEQQIDD